MSETDFFFWQSLSAAAPVPDCRVRIPCTCRTRAHARALPPSLRRSCHEHNIIILYGARVDHVARLVYRVYYHTVIIPDVTEIRRYRRCRRRY